MDINLEEFLKIPSQNEKEKPRFTSTRMPLTTKKGVELLLEGKLGKKVCKFCLHIDSHMYEMGQIFEIAGKKATCKVTVRDMIGSLYPFKITSNPELPMLMCNNCLNRTISSYLFAQQCDRSERAFQNFIDDMDEKFDKLDPLERPKKRGRQKLNPNPDTLYTEHELVYEYADPQMCLINRGNDLKKSEINPLECPKCWRQFSSVELKMNHEALHPQSMWYCCRICGTSFPKHNAYKRHIKECHEAPIVVKNPALACKCKCGNVTENYSEHLQHIEKHKFKTIMRSMMDGKMDKLCVICLGKEKGMVNLDMSLRLHGGYPEITGDRSLHNILTTTLPNQNQLTQQRKYPILNIAKMFKTKLDYIKNKNESEVAEKREDIPEIKEDVTEIKKDDAEIKEDVTELKDVIENKEDVTEIKEDVTEIKEDVTEIREDVTDIKENVTAISEDVTEIREDVTDIKKVVKEISEDIKIDTFTFSSPIIIREDVDDKTGKERIKITDNTIKIQETQSRKRKYEEEVNIDTPEPIFNVSELGLIPKDNTFVHSLHTSPYNNTITEILPSNEHNNASELDIKAEHSEDMNKENLYVTSIIQAKNNVDPPLENPKQDAETQTEISGYYQPQKLAEINVEAPLSNVFKKQDANTQTEITEYCQSQKPTVEQTIQTDSIFINLLEKEVQVDIQKSKVNQGVSQDIIQPMEIDELGENKTLLQETILAVNCNNQTLNTCEPFNFPNPQVNYIDPNTSKVDKSCIQPVTQVLSNSLQFTIGTGHQNRVPNTDSGRRIIKARRRH